MSGSHGENSNPSPSDPHKHHGEDHPQTPPPIPTPDTLPPEKGIGDVLETAPTRMRDPAPLPGSRDGTWKQPGNTDMVFSAGKIVPPADRAGESIWRFGDYELLEEIARGGMGVVFKARQVSLDRLVALKMILSGGLASAETIGRFRMEARAAAQLDHPGIVPIYEIGQIDRQLFFSMALITGGNLQQLLAQGPLDPRQAAHLAREVAEAIQYAHERGVIHRDLKPANILLVSGKEDTHHSPLTTHYSPKVTDFGLARMCDSELSVTGQVMGTPSYMPPEQAVGDLKRVGPASDVYSLGAVLYCLLTGQPPFQAPSVAETIRQLQEEEAVPPSRLNPRCPRDLETVCLKCLEKEPTRRYASARALSEDLGRFLSGRPVLARPVGRLDRAWRWCRRNPAVASLLVMVALLLATGTGISTVLAVRAGARAWEAAHSAEQAAHSAEQERLARGEADRLRGVAENVATREKNARQEADRLRKLAEEAKQQIEREKHRADDERSKADRARVHAEWLLYGSRLALAQREWQRNNVVHANQLLANTPEDFRGWEYRYLNHLFNKHNQRTLEHSTLPRGISFSPDGKRLVSGGSGSIKVWDVGTGQVSLSLDGFSGPASFSPDGGQLLTGTTVRESATGHKLFDLAGAAIPGCFSPDGKRIATGSRDGTIKVFAADTGREVLSLKGHARPVTGLCFSPDSRSIASGSADETIRLWDAQTGLIRLTLKPYQGIARSVVFRPDLFGLSFSPDGQRLAAGCWDRAIRVWSVPTGEPILTLQGHTGPVTDVCFSPDGKRIVSGSKDLFGLKPGEVKVWDNHTGREVFSLKGHTKDVKAVAFSPDGTCIASSADGEVKLWDARRGQDVLTLGGHNFHVRSLCFSRDARRLFSGSRDGTFRAWDMEEGREVFKRPGHGSGVEGIAVSPDGRLIATGGDDRLVKLWDTGGREVRTLKGHTLNVYGVCFSPDGQRLASASWDRTAKVWDVESGRELLTLRGHTGPVIDVDFSPDGKRLATVSHDRTVRLWDAGNGKEVMKLWGHLGDVRAVCFSPDGKELATGARDRTVILWNVSTGLPRVVLRGHTDDVRQVCFTPDGRRVITSGRDRTVRFWDRQTGEEVFLLQEHAGPVYALALSRDGNRLATGSGDETIKVWVAGP
jgi:WD40 repeat protein